MSDLVQRLRGTSYALPSEGEWVEVDGDTMPNNVCTQAADRIETLEVAARKALALIEIEWPADDEIAKPVMEQLRDALGERHE